MTTLDFINELQDTLAVLDLAGRLSLVAKLHAGAVAFSSSFGQEDQVITDAIFRNNIDIRVFTLDTGRLFQETSALIDETRMAANIDRMQKHLSALGVRLRPHVKTHKLGPLVKRQIELGITKYKCATIAEAEMCAQSGAPDVLLAMPCVASPSTVPAAGPVTLPG